MARPGIRAAVLEPFYQEVSSDPINEILHVWQRGWLSEDVLSRTDRMAAACGIHTRFPMLDSEFLATAAGIPGPEKCRRKGVGYIAKAPLRGAMQGRLSERLLELLNFHARPLDVLLLPGIRLESYIFFVVGDRLLRLTQ